MGDYFLGTKIINAVSDNPALQSLVDKMDGQLASLLGPRDIPIPMPQGHAAHPGAGGWEFDADNDPPRWEETSASNDKLHVSLPVHEGWYFDSIVLVLDGNAEGGESPDGSIVIYRAPFSDSMAKAVVATLDDTDPWNINAAGPKKFTYSGIDHTIAAGYYYWLEVVSVGGAAGGDECYYYGGFISQAQLGT